MGSADKRVSIIIPVFNGEKYLVRCLDSVVDQTYGNIEIILVDDGSSDDSVNICERYASSDDRILFIRKDNSGVSDTRNTGISHANGEFIIFIDCDDYVEKDYVAHLVSLMSDDVDFGITGWRKEKEDGSFIEDCTHINGEYGKDGVLAEIASLNAVQGYPVSKIFRHSVIKDNGLEFDKEITIFEDLLFCCSYANCCRKAKINTEYYDYHYLIREDSSRNVAIHAKTFDTRWLTEIRSLEKLLGIVEDSKKAKKKVRARIALSSSFYINRMFDCKYEDSTLQNGLRSNVKKNLAQAIFSKEGDIKWKMQALLCAVSPKLEYRFKSRK